MADRPVRLIGVRLEQLPGDVAGALWSDDAEWQATDRAVDAVAERFGAGAVRPARLLRGGDAAAGAR
jgi:DNA polymerase-4